MSTTRLTFLGTGGGRFATMTQARATGGLYIEDEAAKVHVDPGPGALVQLHECGLDPSRTTGILLSHAHLDHCNDAAVLMEAMTRGSLERRGFVLGSRSVLDGAHGLGPVITDHHRKLVASAEVALPGRSYRVSGLRVDAHPTDHTDPTTVSFRIGTNNGDVSYFTDSAYRRELVEPLRGSRVIVLGVTRPRGHRIENHLDTEDAADVAERLQPDLLVLTHLGLKVLRRGPEKEAEWVQKQTGIRTVAATDRMRVFVGKGIDVRQGGGRGRGRGGRGRSRRSGSRNRN